MEKEKMSSQEHQCKAYACFEEPQTLKLLSFIEVSQDKVTYKGTGQDQGRRQKHFNFESISFLTQKLRNVHSPIVRNCVDDLLSGKSSAVLMLGNDEAKKQKMLIGQSQNQGLLLHTLANLFETCYQRELEDRVTIKLSCWEYRDGKIGDLLGGTGSKCSMSNWIAPDLVQGTTLVGIPQIIIRNMKSALKMIRLFMKSAQLNRQHCGNQTQNLTFTIKLQMDSNIDKQGIPTQYTISKLHIMKLGRPYSPKAPTKHAPWFITLFNYLQAHTLEKGIKTQQIAAAVQDDFSSYLKGILIKGVSSVHCLTVFNNKMTSNDCLTALKFSSYLQHLKLNPSKMIIDVNKLRVERESLEKDVVKTYAQNQQQKKGSNNQSICRWLDNEQNSHWLDLQMIGATHFHLMQAHNILQFQYANHLTVGCDKLEKYIYTEQVQDYFYAKKIILEPNSQFTTALTRYLQMRKNLQEAHTRFIKKIGSIIAKIKKEPKETKQWKYLLNTKIKAKQLIEKLFDIYFAQSTHFLYEKNEQAFKALAPILEQSVEEQPLQQIQENIQQIISRLDVREREKKQDKSEVLLKVQESKLTKKKKDVDQTEMMFTNSNVGLCRGRHRN